MIVRYTIIDETTEDPSNWGDGLNEEQALECIKKTVKDDPSYVLDGLDRFSIQVELIPEFTIKQREGEEDDEIEEDED